MFYTDDPVADSYRFEAEQERRLARRPLCSGCRQHIQEEVAYYINGNWFCPDCIDSFAQVIDDE